MKTPLTLLVTVLATLAALCLPQAAYALTCARPDAPHMYEKSAWVAKATVLKINGIQSNVDGFGGQAVDVLVKIDRLYKGQPRPNIRETNFNPEQRVVFGHVPQIGHRYTLFVQEDFALGAIDKALKWISPNWGSPAQIAGKSCYRGDILIEQLIVLDEIDLPIYAFIASLDKPSQGGSVLLEVYWPWPDKLRQQAMRGLKLFLKPLGNANPEVSLVQAPSGYFRAANVLPGNYHLVLDLPNRELGLDRPWFYDQDAALVDKVFYRLVQKEDGKNHCALLPAITLKVNDRGQVTRRFRLDTVPNESLEDVPTRMKKGGCQ